MSISMRFLPLAVFIAVLALFTGARARAESSPRVLITWRAQSFTPAGYQGKALPTARSPILATVEILEQGKFANLAEYEILWYQNNRLLDKGIGKYLTSFRAPSTAPDEAILRVEIPGYPSGPIVRSVNIPVAAPEAVIEAPLPLLRFRPPAAVLAGAPYFFNISDSSLLEFTWTANRSPASAKGNPRALKLSVNENAAPETPVLVSLSITNPLSPEESADTFVTLTTQ